MNDTGQTVMKLPGLFLGGYDIDIEAFLVAFSASEQWRYHACFHGTRRRSFTPRTWYSNRHQANAPAEYA